jgi:hypothetical protein
LVVIAVMGVAALMPGIASAHVGRTLPVATDFTARLVHAIPGLRAKVLDGDQTLWLRVPPQATVSIPGTLGEPLLLFDPRGVWLNLRSPTAQSDGIDRLDLEPTATGSPPKWHHLTGGHAYAWHEHRLHVLEPLARERGVSGAVGPWAVPVVEGSRRSALGGVLDYRPPGAVWAWIAVPVALAFAAAAAALRWAWLPLVLAFTAIPPVWAIRIGRELYGRPAVGPLGYVAIAVTSVVGVLLLYGLLHRDRGLRAVVVYLVGVGAIYEGLTMFPLLNHAIALNALPTAAARVIEAIVVVAGVGTLLGALLSDLFSEVGRDMTGAVG